MNLENMFKHQIYSITCFEHSRGRSTEYVVSEMLEAGIRIIQYREKHRSKRIKYEECMLLRKITRRYNAIFIVNDDVDIALLADADGIHIGQDDLPLKEVRKLIRKNQFIGISTHNPRQAREAVKAGADYIGVGPVFKTETKEEVFNHLTGTKYIRYVVKNINLPFVAIGGVKKHNIDEVIKAGAECVSLVTEITGTEDIREKAKNIFKRLRSLPQK